MRPRLLVVLSTVALVLPLAAASQTGPRAALRIADAAPITLRGAHFRAHEHIRVTVVMGEKTLARRLRAGALGGFTVTFAGARLNYCALPLVITARGASSGLVRARLPLVDCAEP
jgi:hypothetical protein